jgi:hypothetical protein
MWIDIDHRGGKMRWGIECEKPPFDKYYLLWIAGPSNEETRALASYVLAALRAVSPPQEPTLE